MGDPTQAAHVLGKLLKALGPERILWGTDSIWYGTPQDQIQAFRAFQITEEFQERFGYPALTDEVKARILGRNAAELYGVEPTKVDVPVHPGGAAGGPRGGARRVPHLRADHRPPGARADRPPRRARLLTS